MYRICCNVKYIYMRVICRSLILNVHAYVSCKCVDEAGTPCKVICMLVAMVFNLAGLEWNNPMDHAELFSGQMSVTIGELEALRYLLAKLFGGLVYRNLKTLSKTKLNVACKVPSSGLRQSMLDVGWTSCKCL